uniref:Fe2OG dioxygenase domain-containing protein n=1 Tax=viral metagenome TaxID=1070528 RepID=A0A6C0K5J0_9ZZZZ
MTAVPGLFVIHNVFHQQEEDWLCEQIEKDPKKHPCRQIHYAYEYGWKFLPILRKTVQDDYGVFPSWIQFIGQKIKQNDACKTILQGFLTDFYTHADHVLLNIYSPGEGCVPHTDEVHFWNEWVIGVSLHSDCIMRMSYSPHHQNFYVDVPLPHGSVYILTGQARYIWQHAIVGSSITQKRYSITLRSINSRYLPYKAKKFSEEEEGSL